MAGRELSSASQSPIEAELARRAAEQDRARTGGGRPLPPLIRLYGYSLLTCSFLGFWVWAGLLALGMWLLDANRHSRNSGILALVGWDICWILVLPATLLWHAPELLRRMPGPLPRTANGFAGYLLRNSRKGVFDGSLPLMLDNSAPPPHFWLVSGLFTAFSAYWAVASTHTPVGGLGNVGWVGCAACAASLGILTHGTLARRRARKNAIRQKQRKSGSAR